MSKVALSGNASGTGTVTLASPNTNNNPTFTLPSADGTNGQVLQTNGSGTLSFASQTSLASPLAVTGNSTAGAEIRLPEDTDNGSNYVALKAADNIASNVTFTLPSADGTNGQVLQTNGSGTLSFATPATGALTLISTQTASSSSSIEWTGLSGYRSYLLVISNFIPTVETDCRLQVGTGAGPTYVTTNYYWAALINASNSSTPDGTQGAGDSRISLTPGDNCLATTASGGLSATIYLNNMLASPAADVRFDFKTVFPRNTATFFKSATGNGTLYNNTTAKTAVKIFFDATTIASGSASLYGLQSS